MSFATTFKLQMTFFSCKIGLQTTIFLLVQETKNFTNICKNFIIINIYVSYFYVKIFREYIYIYIYIYN
jgi:hypothetical protein